MAYNVLDIANKLLKKAEMVAESELMSNMRLQKMLYYEQGYHLAAYGTPLFDEEIEGWMYGPVVPCVYEHYKSNGASGIQAEEKEILMSIDEEELFNEVFDAYLEFSTYGLMRKTHQEEPWASMKNYGPGNVISKESLLSFFKTKLA